MFIKLNGSPEEAKVLIIRNMEELDKLQQSWYLVIIIRYHPHTTMTYTNRTHSSSSGGNIKHLTERINDLNQLELRTF